MEKTTAVEQSKEEVKFEHVGLCYAGAGEESLTDISFTAEKGQMIGVIGGPVPERPRL